MAANSRNNDSALEEFLQGPSLDPEDLGEPPLSDGEDPLLTREPVSFYSDDDE